MHHRHDLYARWALEMRRQELFHAGQRIGVAVSGGPDSVLLLHFMKMLASEWGLTIAAVHFNHHLRGAESDGDEALVRGLAEAMRIEYLRGEADVGRAARERRYNLEAVAREWRYRFFFSLVDQGRLDRVATAHTANDQAETVLMRLLRGTGTRGLGGIYPRARRQSRSSVSRPDARRSGGGKLRRGDLPTASTPRTSTSACSGTRSGRELLPLLAQEYNPEIYSLLNQLADRSRDDEACLERLARDRAQPWRMREGKEERIAIRALLELPAALARRVLRQMLHAVRGSSLGLTHVHVESLRRFAAEAQSGKVQTLPGGVAARKEFSWLVVAPVAGETVKRDYSYPVTLPGELVVPELGSTFRFKILARGDPGRAYNLDKLAGLDPQKLAGEVVLRNWRAGDSLCPLGSRGTRKLKELFRERKIPENRRKDWPVMLCAGQIVWVRGFPPAKNAAATNQTERVLIVEEELTRPSPVTQEKLL